MSNIPNLQDTARAIVGEPEFIDKHTAVHKVALQFPGGEHGVTVRVNRDDAVSSPEIEEARIATLLKLDVPTFMLNAEREYAAVEARYKETVFDPKTGKEGFKVTGRERELLEMRGANLARSLQLDRITANEALKLQAEARKQEAERVTRVDAAVQKRAQEIADADEVERRALQLAHKLANASGRQLNDPSAPKRVGGA